VAAEDLAARPAETQRAASLSLGTSLLRTVAALATPAEVEAVSGLEAALGGRAPRATAFGAVAAVLGAAEEDAAEAHAYTVAAGATSAAVRLRLLGPLEAQVVLRRVLNASLVSPTDEWFSFSPLLDLAAMRHELLEPRLFAS
jgi:urease accessory protein